MPRSKAKTKAKTTFGAGQDLGKVRKARAKAQTRPQTVPVPLDDLDIVLRIAERGIKNKVAQTPAEMVEIGAFNRIASRANLYRRVAGG